LFLSDADYRTDDKKNCSVASLTEYMLQKDCTLDSQNY